VAAVQYAMAPVSSFKEFASRVKYLVEVAAAAGAHFVVFPEMVTNQLLALHPGARPQEAPELLARYTADYLALFRDEATARKLTIVGGSHFTREPGGVFNISYVFKPDGQVGKQYKIHVTPGERATWGIAPGHAVEVFDSPFGKFAVNICYDVEFPELARLAVERGAQLLLVPYCTDDRRGHLRVRYCAQARCVENQIYVVTAGVAGNLRGVHDRDVHYAQSAVLTPSDHGFARDGVAGEAAVGTEAVVVEELDMSLLERAKQSGTVRNWIDRRTDLYKVTLLR
jgi:predicted amidohydrolase